MAQGRGRRTRVGARSTPRWLRPPRPGQRLREIVNPKRRLIFSTRSRLTTCPMSDSIFDFTKQILDFCKHYPSVPLIIGAIILLAVLGELWNRWIRNRYREFLGPDGSISDSTRDRFEHPERYRHLPESKKFIELRRNYESFKERNPELHAQQMREFEARMMKREIQAFVTLEQMGMGTVYRGPASTLDKEGQAKLSPEAANWIMEEVKKLPKLTKKQSGELGARAAERAIERRRRERATAGPNEKRTPFQEMLDRTIDERDAKGP
jgi:hypothetical protein